MKSKICITILIVMMIFSTMTTINFKSIASTTASFELDAKIVAQGSNVEVNVNLRNDVDFSAGNFELTYDSSVLEFVDYTIGSSLKNLEGNTNGTVSFNGNTKGKIKFAYMSEVNQTSETKTAGKLITLIFKVKSGAGTSTDIALKVTTLKKADGTDVNTNIKNGKLKIISGVQINKSNVALEIGKKLQLNISTLPTVIDISNETVTWKSADTSVAIVNQNGLVTAVGVGTTQITAKLLGYSAVCIVNISEPIKVNLSEAEITIPSQQIKLLKVTSNESLEDKIVRWSSSNEDVATVNQNGVVTAIKEGTADITVSVEKQKATEDSVAVIATCKVVVSGQLGDVDKDKKITAYDAYKALEASVNLLIGIDVDEQVILTTDVDRDQKVTAQDAYKILQHSVGEIDKF